jgi:hypothetical protein
LLFAQSNAKIVSYIGSVPPFLLLKHCTCFSRERESIFHITSTLCCPDKGKNLKAEIVRFYNPNKYDLNFYFEIEVNLGY